MWTALGWEEGWQMVPQACYCVVSMGVQVVGVEGVLVL